MEPKQKHDRVSKGYGLIFGYLGIFLIVIGIVCLIPLLMVPFFISEAGSILAFLIPGTVSALAGFGLTFLNFKKERSQLGKHQDAILLVLIWLFAILVGSVPFMLRGLWIDFANFSISFKAEYAMSFNDAVFESASGYSASGLTLFNFSSEAYGYHLFTFYRSILLLVGGVGLVLVVTSAISDRYGLKLYTAEGHNDKLMPNLAKSARLILLIYVGYIIVGTVFYFLGGMTIFDAFNHAIAAVATGGFSTHAGGIPELIANPEYVNEFGLHPNSIIINLTSIMLMILGATNFLLHLFIFKGKIKHVIKDVELRFFGLLCIIFIPMFFLAIWLVPGNYDNPLMALNNGIFYFFSAITTTGFNCVVPIAKLGEATIFLAAIMMCIGGGMGSTAGAIKQYRVVLAAKSFYWSVRDAVSNKRKVMPHDVYRLGQRRDASFAETHEAQGYMILYFGVLIAGSVLILILGANGGTNGLGPISIGNAFFEFASALSGTGLSVGVTSAPGVYEAYYTNYIAINWVLVVGMFLGRLEIMAVYFAFYRVVRDIFRKETV